MQVLFCLFNFGSQGLERLVATLIDASDQIFTDLNYFCSAIKVEKSHHMHVAEV